MMNGKTNSKRFLMSLIGYVGTMAAALLKNWLPGVDTSLVITAAGIVTAYTAVQSFRPSEPEIRYVACAPKEAPIVGSD